MRSVLVGILVMAVACGNWNPADQATAAPSPLNSVQAETTADDPRVGRKILITQAGAELKTPEATVWRAYLGEVFTVSLVNGEWLWIAEKKGWMWEQHGILLDKAIQETSQRLQENESAENLHLRGVAWLAHGEYDKAVKDFTACLAREPKNAGALNNRGKARYLQQEYTQAIADFSSAIAADPEHFLALNNRALAYIAVNQLDQALTDLQAALKLHPKYPEALNNRGVVYQQQGQSEKAISDFTEALKIDPNYSDAYGNRAFAYRSQGQYAAAIKDLRTAIQKDPLNFEPVNDLGWLLATAAEGDVRDADEALKLARQACEMSQYQNWNALDTLAAAAAEAGDFKAAAQWIATAIQNAPEEYREGLEAHQELIQDEKPIRE